MKALGLRGRRREGKDARSSLEGNAPMNVKGKDKRERVNGDTSKEQRGIRERGNVNVCNCLEVQKALKYRGMG